MMRSSLLVLIAMSLGATGALLIPADRVLFAILPPFVMCLFLSWYVAFENKAVKLTPFRWLFWPWIELTTPVRRSRALLALFASAGFGAGGCLVLIVRVAMAS